MRTKGRQLEQAAGASTFTWVDSTGAEWVGGITWAFIGGRVECVGLSMDSEGKAPVTSTVMREVERILRDKRKERAQKVKRLSKEPGDVGRRADRQVAGHEARPKSSPGRPEADWMARCTAMREAWEQRRPLIQALRDLEPHLSDETHRKNIDRARAWAKENAPGLLDGVGRPKKEGT